MKLFGCIAIAVGLAVAAVGIFVYLEQPILQEPVVSTINQYGNTCVVTVTHPDPQLIFKRVENECDECLYYFCIVDNNSPIGTHAEDGVLKIHYQRGPVGPNGQRIPVRRIDGSFDKPIQPIEFDEIRFGEVFAIEAPCPNCLRDDERYITFNLTYWDCSGLNDLGEMYFDLKTQRQLDYVPAIPPTVIDCRPGDPCIQQPKPAPCGC